MRFSFYQSNTITGQNRGANPYEKLGRDDSLPVIIDLQERLLPVIAENEGVEGHGRLLIL